MNLSVIKTAVTSKVGLQLLTAQKHSPAILFGVGVVGVVGTVVLASRATLQLSDVLDEFEDNKELAKQAREEHPEKYTSEMAKSDTVILHSRLVKDIVKLYAPSVALGIGSIAALSGSHIILTKRNAGLTAAVASLSKAFSEYRGRVVADAGADKDKEYMFGSKTREVYSETKKGEPKVEEVKTAGDGGSLYTAVFDFENYNFQSTLESNAWFLRQQQNYLNDQLRSKGHVFLNDVFRELGMDDTEAGAVTGWIWRGDDNSQGDNYIDFGCWKDHERGGINPFMLGKDGSIQLDFNVDGPIFKSLKKSQES